jgi:hypothetical protein
MMDVPVFIIQFDAIVVFLEEVRSTAIRAHDRFRHHSSDFHAQDSVKLGRRQEMLRRIVNVAGADASVDYCSWSWSKPWTPQYEKQAILQHLYGLTVSQHTAFCKINFSGQWSGMKDLPEGF